MLTGCLRNLISNLKSYNNLRIKYNVAIIIRPSAGKEISELNPCTNDRNGTEIGKKAIKIKI